MRKIFITLLAAIAATCLAIGITACSSDSSKDVRQIGLGYTHEQVEKLMGEPDEKTSDTLWVYYGNDYKDLNAKLETNAEQLLTAIEKGDSDKAQSLFKESLELEDKLSNLTYEHTEIIFARSGEGYGVTNVFYDAMHKDSADAPEKLLVSVKLTNNNAYYYIDQTKGENHTVIVNENMGKNLPYTAEYADGSYSMGLIANAKISDTDSSMNWSDKFGA
ncbi:MAG: hypothetical protein K2I29_02525, partial [Clostridia bacterium]|nr:hypothetical protein [Clostridia bacterium]